MERGNDFGDRTEATKALLFVEGKYSGTVSMGNIPVNQIELGEDVSDAVLID